VPALRDTAGCFPPVLQQFVALLPSPQLELSVGLVVQNLTRVEFVLQSKLLVVNEKIPTKMRESQFEILQSIHKPDREREAPQLQ
jgi:hypothetical protein